MTMKKIISGLVTTIILSGCTQNKTPQNQYSQDKKNNTAENLRRSIKIKIRSEKGFLLLKNYQWQEEKPAFIRIFH
jgi:PBP1b-binding outer membrane lipoprotein LpoB